MVQPIPKLSSPSLTGKTRYRISKSKWPNSETLLVLQVEETYYTWDWDDVPPSLADKWNFRWRDATIEDVTEGAVC